MKQEVLVAMSGITTGSIGYYTEGQLTNFYNMRFDELNENNYMLFAIKFYDNPHALTKEEFEDDLKQLNMSKDF